tara:strand:- start:251 stop:706 length:456 start_codon:yes stop_codon:yes gene_type:complete
MINEETKEKINYDFKDVDNLINDEDHIVRKYYQMFLNGDYGQDIFNKYFNLYVKANDQSGNDDYTYSKKMRALAIQSFAEYNSIDYGISHYQFNHYLKNHIGLDNTNLYTDNNGEVCSWLEKLNIELIKDIENVYNSILCEKIIYNNKRYI